MAQGDFWKYLLNKTWLSGTDDWARASEAGSLSTSQEIPKNWNTTSGSCPASCWKGAGELSKGTPMGISRDLSHGMEKWTGPLSHVPL